MFKPKNTEEMVSNGSISLSEKKYIIKGMEHGANENIPEIGFSLRVLKRGSQGRTIWSKRGL